LNATKYCNETYRIWPEPSSVSTVNLAKYILYQRYRIFPWGYFLARTVYPYTEHGVAAVILSVRLSVRLSLSNFKPYVASFFSTDKIQI